MNYKLLSLICLISLLACQNDKKKQEIPEAYDLKIELETSNLKVDSIALKSVNEKHLSTTAYKNGVALFQIGDSINDLYDLKLYTSKDIINQKIWLKGDAIHIKGKLNPQLSIDTVINSPLYYKIKENSKTLRRLYEEDEKNPEIDAFFLRKIEALLDSPVSFAMADTYLYRNKENLGKLQGLKEILEKQPKNLKEHPLNISQKLDRAITQLEK